MFNGFSNSTTDFLWGIRFNNEREWFLQHKQEYLDSLWNPFKELANEVYDKFCKKHADLCLNLHVSRIYRDARRLHGRGPYKDHLWFSLRPQDENWQETPVFWFEINPEGYCFGLGVYAAKPEMMARFRHMIDINPAPAAELAASLKKQKVFEFQGEEYARKKGNPEPPLDEWYNKKYIDIVCQRGIDKTLNSRALVDDLVRKFEFLIPFYRYFDKLSHPAE